MLSVLIACSEPPAAKPPAITPQAGARPDIVLITLDTVRADRLGAYGYEGAKTETLDQLAREGIRFERAVSVLPLTIPAHASIFTGLYPYHHQIRANGDNVLAESFTTLAEILKGAGYQTAASVAAFVTTRQWGLSQGFEAYFDQMPEETGKDRNFWHTERPGAAVVDDALSWLSVASADKPHFLWVHLYDAHFPYVPVGDYAESHAKKPYDGEIAGVDDQVQRIVDAVAGRKVLFAIMGDHGESLGQHGEETHGLFTYEATQRVPFILSGTGVTPGVVAEPVSQVDVLPTLLHAAGIAVPTGLDGVVQPGGGGVPYSESYQLSERFRIAPHRTVVEGNLKLIATARPELYDLAADPEEKSDLAATRPDDVARLRALLEAKGAVPPGASSAVLDAETVQQLAALGYVGGGSNATDAMSLPDAKELPDFIAMLGKIDRAGRRDGPEATLTLIDQALALKSDSWELRMRKANLLAATKNYEAARAFAEETAKLFPDRARIWVVLAGMAAFEKDKVGALAFARRAVEADPRDAVAQEALVTQLLVSRLTDEAVAAGTKFMDENPTSDGVAAVLGRHYLARADLEKAEKLLRVAVSGASPRRGARAQLAMLAVAAKAKGDALALLSAEVRDFPGNHTARAMLSRLYAEEGRWLDQKPHAAFLAQAQPREATPQLNFAQCLFNLAEYGASRRTLDVALSLAPEDPEVLLLHANLLAKEGKRDEGYAVFQRASALRAAPKAAVTAPGLPR